MEKKIPKKKFESVSQIRILWFGSAFGIRIQDRVGRYPYPQNGDTGVQFCFSLIYHSLIYQTLGYRTLNRIEFKYSTYIGAVQLFNLAFYHITENLKYVPTGT